MTGLGGTTLGSHQEARSGELYDGRLGEEVISYIPGSLTGTGTDLIGGAVRPTAPILTPGIRASVE